MGELYEQGIGIPKDLKKSKEFYQKAADKGEVRAMYKLAEILQDEGGEEDKWAIRYWLEQAAMVEILRQCINGLICCMMRVI